MVNKTVIVIAGIGAATAVGALLASQASSSTLTSPTGTVPSGSLSSQLSSLSLSSSALTTDVGNPIQVTATAHDQYGNPYSGVNVKLVDTTTNTSEPMGTTDSNGQVSANVSFPSVGVYRLNAEAS